MASIVQEIQVIRSIRKDLRDVTLPLNILNSIESIHNCIKTGTDLNGWKKVDWRGSNSGHAGYNSVNGGSRSGASTGTFLGNRHGNSSSSGPSTGASGPNSTITVTREYQTRESFSSSTNYSFCNRSKVIRQSVETSVVTPSSHYATKTFLTASSVSITSTTVTAPVISNNTVNITATSATSSSPPPVSFETTRLPPVKYVSKFKKSSEKVEDTILNTIILGKLNKFSEQNYDEIKEFITHIIDNGETDMIKCFMKLVFEKAASEEMFCPLYGKLLSELSLKYPVLLTEMANLYKQYMEIFEEVSENTAENYNEVCKRNVEKKYRRGYSQFLAELIKHDIIDIDIFIKTVNKILSQMEKTCQSNEFIKLNEEFADCLMKIIKAIETKEECELIRSRKDDTLKVITLQKILKNDTIEKIKPLTMRNSEMRGISNKTRFTFLDIYDRIQKF